MNKTNETKKVSSIAIKINANFVRKLFLEFLLIDILLIVIVLAWWCIQEEVSYFGDFVLNAKRIFHFLPIESSSYTVTWQDGQSMVRDASEFLIIIKKIASIILIFEGILLLKEIAFGTRKIRKSLRPLNEIAETASRLSKISFDENKVQNLEEAISKISPTSSEEKIHTGNTELKGLEESINNLLDRMRESYRQQARFVSDASHELRTPISVIQGYANMLDRWGKEDEKILNESISAIKSESENMKNLVEQLLFLARGINGKTRLNITVFSLKDMVNEVYEESKMIDEKHIYKFDCSSDIAVCADQSLLKQVLRILMENAAKYSGENEIIKFKIGKNEKGEAYFYVQDNGIGMDGKDVAHIFERFFRADTARDRKTGGTGLGLSIAKWIIDQHEGYFNVLSSKGIGTRITVVLPKKSIKY
ncbi:MAG: HAMP domain-containing histidine kinase [Clostridiales bacterium]|nr:HAMP domain-containing histidine kinase [Clostridiales bacterium]